MAKRILLVEDEPVTRRIVRVCLRAAGFDVVEAGGGAQALRAAAQRPPDLALIDLRLPDCSGTDLARRLRGLDGMAGVPICAISGVGAALDSARLRGDLFEDFFLKPLDLQELPMLIRGYLTFRGGDGVTGDLAEASVEALDDSSDYSVDEAPGWRCEAAFLAGFSDLLLRGASPQAAVESALALAVDTGAATVAGAFQIDDDGARLIAHRGFGPNSERAAASLFAARDLVRRCAEQGRLRVLPSAVRSDDEDAVVLDALQCESAIVVGLPPESGLPVALVFGADSPRLQLGGTAVGRVVQTQLHLAALAARRGRLWSGELRVPVSVDPLTGLLDAVGLRAALEGWGGGARSALLHLHIPPEVLPSGPSTPVLRELSQAAKEMTRTGDLVARVSEQDFVVLLGETGAEAASARARMLTEVTEELLGQDAMEGVRVHVHALPALPGFAAVRGAVFGG